MSKIEVYEALMMNLICSNNRTLHLISLRPLGPFNCCVLIPEAGGGGDVCGQRLGQSKRGKKAGIHSPLP